MFSEFVMKLGKVSEKCILSMIQGPSFPWSVVAMADSTEKAVGPEASKVSGISKHLAKALLL